MSPRPTLLVIVENPDEMGFLQDFGYDVIYFSQGKDAIEYLKLQGPSIDLFILSISISLVSGWEILKYIRNHKSYEFMPVIVISETREKTDELLALRSGADDYIRKPFDVDIFLARLDVALRRTMWNKLAFVDLSVLPFKKPPSDFQKLTSREDTILQMIAKGSSNDDIAKSLCLSTLTVKTHIKNIFKKLNVNNRTEAILVGLKLGLVKS